MMLKPEQIEALMQRCYVSNGKLSHYDYHAFAAAVWEAAIEEAASIVDGAETPDGWSNSHIAEAIRALVKAD